MIKFKVCWLLVRDVDKLASHADTLVLEKLARHELGSGQRGTHPTQSRFGPCVLQVKPQRTLKDCSSIKYIIVFTILTFSLPKISNDSTAIFYKAWVRPPKVAAVKNPLKPSSLRCTSCNTNFYSRILKLRKHWNNISQKHLPNWRF